MSERNNKCHFCKIEIKLGDKTKWFQPPYPPQYTIIHIFCECKQCFESYKQSEQYKTDEQGRLEKIEEYIKELETPNDRGEIGGQAKELLEEWSKEAKEIRQKWDIKEEQPQERERAELPI